MEEQNVFKKLGFYVKDFFAHWNTPPKEGYYLPNKEFVAYCVGGMGVQAMGILVQYFAIVMGVHLSVAYNFDQNIVMITGWVMAVLSLIRAPIVGWITDNTNTKFGKYRPYILYTGFATVAAFWLLAFIPNIFMPQNGVVDGEVSKWLVVSVYQVLYFLAYTLFSFFSFGRVGLAQVITPNTNERTKLYSIGGVIDSLGPSIVQLLFPLIANKIFREGNVAGMERLATYQILFPIFGVICAALSLVMFFGTKERIIEEKKVKQKVGFFTGIKQCFQNKYFIIANVSDVIAFGRLLMFGVTNFVCAYMLEQSLGDTMRGIMPTLCAVGFVPGMALAPLIQKKLGKKKMTLVSFGGSSVIAAIMLILSIFGFSSPVTPWLMFVGIFLHNIFASLWTVASPAMTADYCEYQQWKTGSRIDAYMSQYRTVIATIAGLGTSALTAQLLIAAGAPTAEYYADPAVLRNVFIVWGVLSVVTGILAMIPYFFWDLTEAKQLQYARDIRIRGLKEKLADSTLVQEDIPDAVAYGVVTLSEAEALGFSVEGIEESQNSEQTLPSDTEVAADEQSENNPTEIAVVSADSVSEERSVATAEEPVQAEEEGDPHDAE